VPEEGEEAARRRLGLGGGIDVDEPLEGPEQPHFTRRASRLGVERLGRVRLAGHAVLARQLARARRELLDRLPEQRDLVLVARGVVDQPFIACDTGSSPCVRP
jgi:hypothetical protein